jgi:hypothetical protein
MRWLASELVISLLAVLAITAAFSYVAQDGIPSPASALGHGMGVVGFLLMLSTETLYSIRKRFTSFTLFSMNTWLRIHIVTGIVGSYLVVLHSGWKFNGLAGVLTGLTLVMVASGLIGRYIYTALPRNLEGVELEVADLEEQIAGLDFKLAGAEEEMQLLFPSSAAVDLMVAQLPQRGWRLFLGRWWLERRLHQRLRRTFADLPPEQAEKLETLLESRYRLQLQVRSLAMVRRVFALWHLFHVPLSIMLFTLAFVHVGAALYYATFMK